VLSLIVTESKYHRCVKQLLHNRLCNDISYCQGENLQGTIKAVVKNCTPGVTAPIVARHLGTVRAAWRALHVCAVCVVCVFSPGFFRTAKEDLNPKATTPTQPR